MKLLLVAQELEEELLSCFPPINDSEARRLFLDWGLSAEQVEKLTVIVTFCPRMQCYDWAFQTGEYLGEKEGIHYIRLNPALLTRRFPSRDLNYVTVHELRHVYQNIVRPSTFVNETGFRYHVYSNEWSP